MNQKKYIVSALLLLITGIVIFLCIKVFPWKKEMQETSTIIDDGIPVDSLPKNQFDGKMLFLNKCASCHTIGKDAIGPALAGVDERDPWKDSAKLYKYIREPESINKNKYIDSLRKRYGSKHLAFPDITDEQIKAILWYTHQWSKPFAIP